MLPTLKQDEHTMSDGHCEDPRCATHRKETRESTDITGMGGSGTPETVNGATVEVTTRDGAVYVNDAKVITADIKVGSGVIHAIDTVLIPPDMR